MNQTYEDFAKVDRIIAYVVNQFRVSDKHFILSGQDFVGKTATIEVRSQLGISN